MDEKFGFSDSEVRAGIRYAHSKHGLEPDKKFLLESANLVLEEIKKSPHSKLSAVRSRILRNVRVQERGAYVDAIGKMFSERSIVARRNQRKEN